MKLSLISITLIVLIALSTVLALPTPVVKEIDNIKIKRDQSDKINKISRRKESKEEKKEKERKPYELSPEEVAKWERIIGAGKRDIVE
ncbi:hypothetical protein C1645_825911 [Glomus cerebriforme]|uniref:Uncharacterized protein n=1 Tax=Glomus cerebriforme TaxID=658196 RepID=A0A397SRC6_9GLOM|nr:hypothetical protein C1645_825911 [Glomus cerebriforme]